MLQGISAYKIMDLHEYDNDKVTSHCCYMQFVSSTCSVLIISLINKLIILLHHAYG